MRVRLNIRQEGRDTVVFPWVEEEEVYDGLFMSDLLADHARMMNMLFPDLTYFVSDDTDESA